MAISFFQKIRLGMRGWSRRRAEEAAKRDADFIARETSWAKPAAPVGRSSPAAPDSVRSGIDLEGLQIAYLDDSGQIDHYLDTESGEVIEFRSTDLDRRRTIESSPHRYRRIPTRTEESEKADRAEFVKTVEDVTIRRELELALEGADPAGAFRQALARDRAVERSWYNFKNRRAAQAIDRWLNEITF